MEFFLIIILIQIIHHQGRWWQLLKKVIDFHTKVDLFSHCLIDKMLMTPINGQKEKEQPSGSWSI